MEDANLCYFDEKRGDKQERMDYKLGLEEVRFFLVLLYVKVQT
jgi:hypothetical protein